MLSSEVYVKYLTQITRTTLAVALLAGLALLGYWKVTSNHQQKVINELAAMTKELEGRIEERQEMIDRLGRSQRIAHIQVTDQEVDDAGDIVSTEVMFIELDDDGAELARQWFTVPGDVLFIDAWTVKFDQDDVAIGHPLFGRALILLRRIYSDQMAPLDGFPIDTPGAVPPGYATTEIATFEQRIWKHFWQIATDERLATDMGVRVAQGEAVYKPIKPGQIYELSVDAIGGMSLTPLAVAPAISNARSID
jgi:hypothetical protein